MKSLSEINREFHTMKGQAAVSIPAFKTFNPQFPVYRKRESEKSKSGKSFFFYLSIASVFLIGILILARTVGGITWYRVVSDSMGTEIPKGSLIIVSRTNPDKIDVGDTITFRRTDKTIVTHKVIEVIETGESTKRTFRTQGVANEHPDSEPVSAENIIGKVILHLSGTGDFLKTLPQLLPAVFLSALVLTAFFIRWRRFLKRIIPLYQKKTRMSIDKYVKKSIYKEEI